MRKAILSHPMEYWKTLILNDRQIYVNVLGMEQFEKSLELAVDINDFISINTMLQFGFLVPEEYSYRVAGGALKFFQMSMINSLSKDNFILQNVAIYPKTSD